MEETDAAVFAQGSSVVFDFGRELCGGIRVLTMQVESAEHITQIRLRFGESMSECFCELNERYSTNHYSPRDFTHPFPSMSDITIGCTGFRFVRLDFLGNSPVKIAGIYAAFCCADVKPVGSFECDDFLTNKIYETRETVYLNMQNNMLWDGIKRDRLVWAGDLNPEINAVLCAFGNVEHIANSLDFSKNCMPFPGWINGIPSYSMWWIINLYDYYIYSGEIDYLQENVNYLTGALKQLDGCLNVDGNIDFTRAACVGMEFFLDWPTYGTDCVLPGVKALFKIALHRAAYLLKQLNLADDLSKKIAAKLNTEKISENWPKQIYAMRVWAGEEDAEAVVERLKKGGASGVSAFMSSRCKAGAWLAHQ